MIATILPRSTNFHAVGYNEYKVSKGIARLIEIQNFGLHIPADTRSAFPVISVQSPVSIQCCWQS